MYCPGTDLPLLRAAMGASTLLDQAESILCTDAVTRPPLLPPGQRRAQSVEGSWTTTR